VSTLLRHRFAIALCTAALIGLLLGGLQVDRMIVVILAALLGVVAAFPLSRRKTRGGMPEWRHRVDREYRLKIDGTTITLLHEDTPALRFEWRDVVEIQSVAREGFPPLFLRIVTDAATYELPEGIRYTRELEQRFIHALPGYDEQRTVRAPLPEGAKRAASLWRRDDPHPKRADWDD
jgi:hypothetical protein